MQPQDFCPIILTEHLGACRDFYPRWSSLRSCSRVRYRFEVEIAGDLLSPSLEDS
jgi:hypothetical protein